MVYSQWDERGEIVDLFPDDNLLAIRGDSDESFRIVFKYFHVIFSLPSVNSSRAIFLSGIYDFFSLNCRFVNID